MNSELSPEDREHILEHTQRLWENVRGERVFMTGGTGFVGTWLVEAFAAANKAHALGATLVLLTRDAERFRARAPHLTGDPSIELHAGEADRFEAPGGPFAFVVHAATQRNHAPDAARPLSIFDRDLAATRRVLTFARDAGARRVLFTSSGAVYGPQPPDTPLLPESFPGAPDPMDYRSVYGHGKRASEFACASFAHVFGFDAIVARLFAFVGPHLPLDEGYAVGNFLRDVLGGRSIHIAGDGTPVRSYLYAADLAIWLWTLLLRGTGGRAYNVGSSTGISIRQLALTIAATVAPGASVETALAPEPGRAPARYVPSTERAEKELGLRAWIGLEDALQRTFSFHARQRASYK